MENEPTKEATMDEVLVGEVTHYFQAISVAAIQVT